jgi:hypothetical protein
MGRANDHLPDLQTALNDDAQPDMICAESVGSFGDLIDTVVMPSLAHYQLGERLS